MRKLILIGLLLAACGHALGQQPAFPSQANIWSAPQRFMHPLVIDCHTVAPAVGGEPLSIAGRAKIACDSSSFTLKSSINGGAFTALGGGSGTVTTVGAGTVASIFTFSVANPTTTPAISLSFSAQLANCVLAGPVSGSAVAPTCRALDPLDIPTLSPSKITGTAVVTGDSRLSDARTPTAHASTHAAAGSDPVTLTEAQIAGLATDLGNKLGLHATADAAAVLATPRAINGVNFDGSAPITVPAAAGTLTGTLATSAEPAHTGDATNSAGSLAMSVKQLHLTETAINFASSPYTVAAADSVIMCDASSGVVVINLPAASGSGRYLTIKKIDSSSNACTPTRAGSDLIDGATSYGLTVQYAASNVIDSLSGVWSRGHVNQLGGDLSGVSTIATVAKVNGNTPGGTCTNQFARSINSSAVPTCATVALATDVSGTLPAAQMPALTGDVTSSVGGVSTTLANAGAGAGSCTICSTTIDAKGRVTAYSSGNAGANAALSNLASVAINQPLTTSAGTVAALSTTAAAATVSATAGVGLTITADPGVAGTTNAGAAAGGPVTITPGNAARLTSGNANGGDIKLQATSTGVGTGRGGVVQISGSPGACCAMPLLNFDQSNPTGFYGSNGTAQLTAIVNSAAVLDIKNGGPFVQQLACYYWSNASSAANGGNWDSRICRTSQGGLTLEGSSNGAAVAAGALTITADANGSKYTRGSASELLTLSTSGTTTATVGNLATANSIIDSITYRITTTIATATAFTVKVTGGNAFSNIGTATTSQGTLTSGTTGILVPSAFADQYNTSATTLTVTSTGTPSTGVIRLTVFYRQITAPTS